MFTKKGPITNFKLTETPISIDLMEGDYNIWFKGGLSVKLPSDFHISISSETIGIEVKVSEHRLKVRDFNRVKFFRMRVPANDKYKISIENYQGIIVKKSMLPITKLFLPKVAIEKISLQIQRK